MHPLALHIAQFAGQAVQPPAAEIYCPAVQATHDVDEASPKPGLHCVHAPETWMKQLLKALEAEQAGEEEPPEFCVLPAGPQTTHVALERLLLVQFEQPVA